MKMVAGIVSSHAHTILAATLQRTALTLLAEPTPIMEPVIVCVVDAGIPNEAVPNSVIAPAVSAQNPPIGFNGVRLCPIVLTTRQPPINVPKPITM